MGYHAMLVAGAALAAVAMPAGSPLADEAGAQGRQGAQDQRIVAQDQPAGPSSGAPAKPAPSQVINTEEVIVTARRREERLQDVPVTASVMNEDQIKKYSSTSMYDIGQQVPNLTFTKNGGGAVGGGQISIRGIVTANTDASLQQKVATVIDGVQTSAGRITSVPLFDIASTEVLLGPQSLYFGKNSPGGVVSFSSVNPGDEFEGYVRAGYSFKAESPLLEGAVTVPLSDKFSMRVALQYQDSDGYTTNRAQPHPSPFQNQAGLMMPPTRKPAAYDTFGGRVTLRWQPTDRLDFNLKFLGSSANYNSATGSNLVVRCAPGQTLPHTNNPLTGEQVIDPTGSCQPRDRLVSVTGIPPEVGATVPYGNGGVPYSFVDWYITSLTANYTLDDITITSVTGAFWQRSKNFDTFDTSSIGQFKGSGADRESNFSQEVRAVSNFSGPLNFSAGLFFSKYHRLYQQIDYFFNQYDPVANRWFDSWAFDYHDDKTYSAFANLEWAITPELVLTGGGRYTYERKYGSVEDRYVNPNAPPVFLAQGKLLATTIGHNNFSPEATLTWKPAPDLNIYAAYRTGYLSPGITNPGVIPSSLSEDNLVYDAENVKGGEIGIKAQFFGGRLSGDLSVYNYVFHNLQTQQFNAALSTYNTTNVGKAATRGFELQATGQITDELKAHAAVAYTHAYYIDFTTAQCYTGQTEATGCVKSPDQPAGAQDLSGLQFPATPKWLINGGVSWEHPILNSLMMQLTADVYWRGHYNYNSSFGPTPFQKAQAVVNLSARVYPPDADWEAAFIVKNVTNAFYIISGSDKVGGSPGDLQGSINDPREFMLQLTYRFH